MSEGKKDFKREAHIYKILALADMDNGVPEIRFKNEIQKQVELEKYEICEGLKQAINIKNKENAIK
jgi:hypothetical protein